jgi:hypothetical protein
MMLRHESPGRHLVELSMTPLSLMEKRHTHTHARIVCIGCVRTHTPLHQFKIGCAEHLGHVGTQLMTIYEDRYPEESPYAFVIVFSCIQVCLDCM